MDAVNKKIIIGAAILIFITGWYFGYEMQEDYKLPNKIFIKRDGKLKAFALTGTSNAKIITMKNIENPGVYVAFPLYADKNSIDRFLT